jgi:hypothetical protein
MYAQNTRQEKLDSLRAGFISDSSAMYHNNEVKFMFAIDTRSSLFYSTQQIPVNVAGIQFGFSFNDIHTLAVGGYSVVFTQKKLIENDPKNYINISLKMSYGTLFYEYTAFSNKRWEIGFPFEIGSGNYQRLALDSSGKHRIKDFSDTAHKSIVLVGAGVDVTLKIFYWLGFNAMGGYRLVGGDQPKGVNFNGPFWSVGFQYRVGQLYKWLRLREKRRMYLFQVDKINKTYTP